MIQRILVPLDGSPLAEQALGQAAAVARAFDAEILLLRVQEPQASEQPVDSVSWRLLRAEMGCYLGLLAERLRGQGVRAERSVAEGRPAEEILQVVRERSVDLIVLTSHGRGQSRFRLGGTAQKVISHAGVSVLVTHAAEPPAGQPPALAGGRILVALDGSQRSQWALCLAASVARALQGELLLAHVVELRELPGKTPPTPEDRELARKLIERDRKMAERYLAETESLLASSGMTVRTRLVEAPHAAQALERVALEEGCALVVVSAHGNSSSADWLYGTVPERLIACGTLPLLILQDLPRKESAGPAEEAPEGRLAALSSV